MVQGTDGGDKQVKGAKRVELENMRVVRAVKSHFWRENGSEIAHTRLAVKAGGEYAADIEK